MKCPKCGTLITQVTNHIRPRGTRYVFMGNCNKCNRPLHVEGVQGVTPPKVVNV